MNRQASLGLILLRLMIAAAVIGQAAAQDIDVTVRPGSKHSLLQSDRIESPKERSDFSELYRDTNPEGRHDLAQKFVNAYPRSWLLAEAYEAEAKASIDLGLYDRAIAEAKLSLKLFPENALLLVPMANAEAKRGLLKDAEESARNALEYLDVFAAPSGMQPNDWMKLRTELESSADFALGRVYVTRAVAESGVSRKKLLDKAYEVLSTARAWNAKDPDVLYLRGVVQQLLGATREAASDFLEAERNGSVMQAKIRPILERIYEEQRRKTQPQVLSSGSTPTRDTASLEEFLRTLPPPKVPPVPKNDTSGSGITGSVQPGYAGSAACAECHPVQHDAWRRTGMARMLRAYDSKNIMGDFSAGAQFRDGSGTARMGFDTRAFFRILAADGRWQRFDVDYTIGSKWQQAYVTRLPDGRLQVLPVQYNTLHHQWVNYWKLLDPAGSVRQEIRRFPELLPETNYQENCSVCHTSRAQGSGSTERLSVNSPVYREMGVNCEMCHGPAKDHVEAMHGKGRVQMPVSFRNIGNRDEINICSQCHRQSLIRDANYKFDWAEWLSKKRVSQPGLSQPYPDFSRLASYKDGRFRQTTFIVESFTRSACFRKGTARCSTCHNPHGPDFEENPASLTYRDNPDQMCLQCHSGDVPRVEQHTHHPAASPASRCTACHMPRIMDGLMVKAMSHRIDDIPDGEMTARFGQQESPNACLLCHADKDADWVAGRLARW